MTRQRLWRRQRWRRRDSDRDCQQTASKKLVKHLEGISDEDIAVLNIPTGIPLLYELDADLKRLELILPDLYELAIGGTAVGTTTATARVASRVTGGVAVRVTADVTLLQALLKACVERLEAALLAKKFDQLGTSTAASSPAP